MSVRSLQPGLAGHEQPQLRAGQSAAEAIQPASEQDQQSDQASAESGAELQEAGAEEGRKSRGTCYGTDRAAGRASQAGEAASWSDCLLGEHSAPSIVTAACCQGGSPRRQHKDSLAMLNIEIQQCYNSNVILALIVSGLYTMVMTVLHRSAGVKDTLA